jgi:hypothetical protein
LRQLDDEGTSGPRLFTLSALDATALHPGWTSRRMRLTLWCEYSRWPVSALSAAGERRGVYTLDIPRSWWTGAAPAVKRMSALLHTCLTTDFSDAAATLDDAERATIAEKLESARQELIAVTELTDLADSMDLSPQLRQHVYQGAEKIDLDGDQLHLLHQWIREIDADFGSLERIRISPGTYRWVHPRFIPALSPLLSRVSVRPSSPDRL